MKSLITFFLCFLPVLGVAQDFTERPIEDFKTLDQFESVEAFEDYINSYKDDCLYNSYGGSMSVRCYVDSDLWDRELNTYYQLLRDSLSDELKTQLQDAQQSWIETRDETIRIANHFLNRKYNKPGTMYIALRAREASKMISPIIKQRALLLRHWYLSISEK